MSRRVVRVSISLLLVLVLLAGVYTIVYGASSRAQHASVAHSASSYRTLRPVLNTYNYSDLQRPAKVHDCDFDSGYDTSDD
jgi:hypothetical protein